MFASTEHKQSTTPSDWYRVGDFRNTRTPDGKWLWFGENSYQNCIQQVEYRNTAHFVLLRKINLHHFLDGTVIITFTPSYLSSDKIYSLFYDVFPELKPEINLTYPTLVVTPHTLKNQLDKLLKFIDKLNKTNDQTEVNDIFIQELKNIIQFPENFDQHKIKILHTKETTLNKLSQYYGNNSKKTFSEEKFEELLMQNEDPNACLFHTIMNNEPNILELLLIYGANPRTPQNWILCFASAFEIAFNQKNKSCYQLICNNSLKIKPVFSTLIVDSKVTFDSKKITSIFLYNNGRKIYANLQPLETLSNANLNELFSIYNTAFESAEKNESLFETFRSDFSGKNKIIQQIYDDSSSKCKGFNLFEIIELHNTLIIHSVYTAVDPSFRSSGIMILLSHQLSFALQLLNSTINTYTFFTSIIYNSYRPVEKLVHFPKYQTTNINKLVNDILIHIYGKELKMTHKGLVCYVMESTKSKNVCKKQNTSEEKFFREKFLNKKDQVTYTKGVPVLFPASKEAAEYFENIYAPTSLSFKNHVKQFAIAFTFFCQLNKKMRGMLPLTSQEMIQGAAISLPDNKRSFFHPGLPYTEKKSRVIPSKI